MDITLNNGIKFPMFGLGTWQSPKEEVKTAVREALDAGYRHIDTAYMYGNEDAVGEVIEEFIKSKKLKREEVFITTKLPGIHTRSSDVALSLDISLKNLKLTYIDLYLIHGPIPLKNTGPLNIYPMENGKLLVDDFDLEGTWKAMEAMVDQGKAKSIGISNFNRKQIERICRVARILPVTNQVECHAYFPQTELAEFCKEKNIVLTAYSPLGSPGRPAELGNEGDILLDDPVVNEVAKKYKKSPAQILLRWLLQRNIIVIPKSVTPSRIRDNIKVFDFSISKEDMTKLGKLKHRIRYIEGKMYSSHPEYPFHDPY